MSQLVNLIDDVYINSKGNDNNTANIRQHDTGITYINSK